MNALLPTIASLLLLLAVLVGTRVRAPSRQAGPDQPREPTPAPMVVSRTTSAVERLTRSLRSKVVDRLPVGVFVCDAATTLYVNPAFCRLVGRDTAELEGHPWDRFLAPEDRAAGHETMARNTSASDGVVGYENAWLRGDGTTVRLRWRAAPRSGGIFYCTAEDARTPPPPRVRWPLT